MTQEQIDFDDYIKNERTEFALKVLRYFPHEQKPTNPEKAKMWVEMRVAVENILIAYDQMKDKLKAGYAAAPAYEKLDIEGEAEKRYKTMVINLMAGQPPSDFNYAERKAFIEGAKWVAAAPAYKGDENEIIDVLNQCKEYFDDKADADYEDENYKPNKEMGILVGIEHLLERYFNGATPTQPNSVQQNKNNNNEMD